MRVYYWILIILTQNAVKFCRICVYCHLLLDTNCRGAMNNKELAPCSRRGLLAYVYNGVSD